MKKQITEFIAQLKNSFPSVKIDAREFPSGVSMIDIYIGEEWFLLEYSPKWGYGVSYNTPDDKSFAGHDKVFKEWSQARANLEKIISEHVRPVAKSSSISSTDVLAQKPIQPSSSASSKLSNPR